MSVVAPIEHSESLASALNDLATLEAVHTPLAKAMFEAHGSSLYGLDLLAMAALNRSRARIVGFRTLIESRNILCAGVLVRLQLDTAMRFFASFIVDEPHKFALEVLNGARVSRLKDRHGTLMHDSYLAQKLGTDYPWVPQVYSQTSGYVHLSDVHFAAAMSFASDPQEDSTLQFQGKITSTDDDIPESLYIEAVDAFRASTRVLLSYVRGWVITKDNPEVIEELKKAGFGPSGADV